jgi:hypothetical protein
MRARAAATDAVRIAGCVFAVSVESASGPSKQSREIGKDSASSASWNVSRQTAHAAEGPSPSRRSESLAGRNAGCVTSAPVVAHVGRAERGQEHGVAGLDEPGPGGLVERDRDRGGGGVPDPVDVDVDLGRVDLQTRGDGVDDAPVRLVGDEDVDVRGLEPFAREDLAGNVLDRSNGDLEGLVPLHADEVLVVPDGLGGRGPFGAAGEDRDELRHLPVGVQRRRQDPARRIARVHHGRTRTVREDHAGRPVVPVQVLRQCPPMTSAFCTPRRMPIRASWSAGKPEQPA